MAPSRRGDSGQRGGGDERAAAALTGGGPSQLGVVGSMRARDVSRPTLQDLAEAERLVQVSYRPRSHPRPAIPPAAGAQPGSGAQPGNGGKSPDAS